MKRAYYIFFFVFLAPVAALSAVWDGSIVEYDAMNSKDTLVTIRKYGQWWFGAYGGWTAKAYFGKLVAPENTLYGVNPFSRLISIDGGFGSGLFTGVSADYVDNSDVWTYGLKLGAFDRVAWSGETPVSRDTFSSRYENQTILDCIAITPNVRYRLGSTDFFATSGLDFEINTNVISKNRKKYVNTGKIDQYNRIELETNPFRVGLNLGVAYDFFVADINKRVRVKLSPFANLQFGTPYVSDRGSSWNSLSVKVGLTVKFGPDKLEYDTLIFDPNAVRPGPAYNALAQADLRISYPGYYPVVTFEAMEVSVVSQSRIREEISIKSQSPTNDSSTVAALADNKFAKSGASKPKNEGRSKFSPPSRSPKRIDGYQSTADANLTANHKKYLDDLADFIKSNPGYEIRLNAYSDDRGGSIPQNMENSRKRGLSVVNYLIKKNVPRGRILLTAHGAIDNVASNATEEGRRANRRVEITVVRQKQTN